MAKIIKNLLEKEVAFSKVNPKIRAHIKKIHTNNIEFMSSNGLTTQVPTFGDKLESQLMSVYNYDGVSYTKMRETHPVLKISETMKKSTNALLLLSAINDRKNEHIYLDFLAFKLYTSKFKKYWTLFVDEEVMEATYMNLSGRYTITRKKTVSKYFYHIIQTSLDNFKQRLTRCDDQDIIDFVNDISNKLNSYLNSVRNEYAKADKVYKSQTIRGEDIMITNDNQTNKFEKLSYSVVNDEITRGCRVSTLKTSGGIEFLREINNGYQSKPNNIKLIVDLILDDYTKKYGNSSKDIKRDFITYADSGRNKDPNIKINIIDLCTTDKVNKVKFYNAYYKYISIRIYETMSDMEEL